jgi:outer membrane receptor protein involved in Fe transport
MTQLLSVFRSSYLLLALCALIGHVQAQRPGTIEGSIRDTDTQEGLAFVALSVHDAQDSLVGGALSDDDGKFTIADLPFGSLRIKVKALGFDTLVTDPILISRAQPKAGPILLSARPTTYLQAVEITATQDQMQNKIDRKVYAVERNIVSQGGSAADLLNTIPSIEVDIDGQLNLRGNANVLVYIDGKPSTLTGTSRAAILDQFPASSIKSIEVITHPSAKYDPDGTAGIINIITKKDSRQGLNGNITLGVGTGRKYNGAGSLNFRHKRINAYANYSWRNERRWNEGDARVFTEADSTSPWQTQATDGARTSNEHLLKAGIDYFPSDKTSIGLSATASANQRDGGETSDFIEANSLEQPQFRYLRQTVETEPTRNLGAELSLNHRPGRHDQNLDLRASLSRSTEDDRESYLTDSLDLAGNSLSKPNEQQAGATAQTFVLGTGQLDYSRTLGEKLKLELGAKSTLRDIQSAYRYWNLDPDAQVFELDSSISNAFTYQEQVHAAYATVARGWGKVGAEVGLRAEQALTNFTLLNDNTSYENNYFQLFPSGHLAYAPFEQSEWRLGYSRRINRPETDNLNPFTEYSNPKRLRTGNPRLQPEYIHAVELSHLWTYKQGSLSTTAYYRRMTNTVSRYVQSLGGDTLLTTMVNLLDGHSYGLELIQQMRPAKWMEMTLSANLFRSVMDASNVSPGLTLVNYGIDGRFLTTVNFTKKLSLQYTFNYQPPRFGPQGRISARYSMDAALKQNLFKNKASLSLRVSDIFNTLEFNVLTESDGIYSDFYRKRESRIGFLTFAYRFGTEDKSQRRQRREENQNQDRGSGFDF